MRLNENGGVPKFDLNMESALAGMAGQLMHRVFTMGADVDRVKRDLAENQRLNHELGDEFAPGGSQCLPDPDFPGAARRTGGGKVDKIDAGDNEDQASDGEKGIHDKNINFIRKICL